MKTIYKYELQIEDVQELTLPIGAQVISIQNQNGWIVLWAIIDTDANANMREKRIFHCFGTGNPITPKLTSLKFIATVQKDGFVWHYFEEIL